MPERIIQTKETDRFYIFVLRHPDEFEELDMPDEIQETARSISSGSKVRMGRVSNSPCEIQSIHIKKRFGKAKGKDLARKIAREID